MRSFLIGIFLSIQSLTSLISLLFRDLLSDTSANHTTPSLQTLHGYSCYFWFYLSLSILGVLAVGLYIVVACKYKKRKRDDTFNHVAMLEEYFSTGRIHSSRWT